MRGEGYGTWFVSMSIRLSVVTCARSSYTVHMLQNIFVCLLIPHGYMYSVCLTTIFPNIQDGPNNQLEG